MDYWDPSRTIIMKGKGDLKRGYTADIDCTPGRSAVAGHRQLLPDTVRQFLGVKTGKGNWFGEVG